MTLNLFYPVVFILITLNLFAPSTFGKLHKYSFCSGNQQFVFTNQACPGGVLLKRPMVIDRSCHCFGSDLMIFDDCNVRNESSGNLISHSCSKSLTTQDGINWSRKARLLLPQQSQSKPSNFEQDICGGVSQDCEFRKENMAIKNPGYLINEIEDMNPFLSPRKGRRVLKSKVFDIEVIEYDRSGRFRRDVDDKEDKDKETDKENSSKEESKNSSKESSKEESKDSTKDSSKESTKSSKEESKDSSKEESKKSSKESSNEESKDSAKDSSTEDSKKDNKETNSSKKSPEISQEKRDEIAEMVQMLKGIEARRRLKANKGGKEQESDPSLANLRVFKLLEKSGNLFIQLALEGGSNVVPASVVEQAFEVLTSHFLNPNLIPTTTLIEMDEKMSDEIYEQIIQALEFCSANSNTDRYTFVDAGGCPRKLGPAIDKGKEVSGLLEKMPENVRYKAGEEDLILGMYYKIVEAVHAHCFASWFDVFGTEEKKASQQIHYYYWSFLENFFLIPQIVEAFYPENKRGTDKYEAFIDSEEPLGNVMIRIDQLSASIHRFSRFPGYFNKPYNTGLSKPDPDTSPSRRKRSVDTDDFEIWGGRAYCLQKLDYFKPPGPQNSFPRIEYLCNK